MEIPDYFLAIFVLYFLITTMLIIGSMSRYSSRKVEPKNEFTIKAIQKIDDVKMQLAVGLVTGAVVIVYYNWSNCSFFECKQLPVANFFNPWYLSAITIIFLTLILFIVCYTLIWILHHRENNQFL
jgi:hypothetical protein